MATIKKQLTLTFKQPNIAESYGPYASVPEAHAALSEDQLNVIGMTVGIQTGNTIEEHWYQGGTTEQHLVKKQAPSSNILKTALASDVQASLNKADTAVQPADIADFATESELNTGLSSKQNTISASSTINSDFVDDTSGINKFVTTEEKTKINNSIQGVKKGIESLEPDENNIVTIPSDIEGAQAISVQSNQSATATIDSNHVLQLEIPRGADGQDGADAYNPFKGTYLIADTLPATGQSGDYIYVVDSATPQVTHVYSWDGMVFSDTLETVTMGDSQFANSTKPISQTNVVNDFSGGQYDLASADETKNLNNRVLDYDAIVFRLFENNFHAGNNYNTFTNLADFSNFTSEDVVRTGGVGYTVSFNGNTIVASPNANGNGNFVVDLSKLNLQYYEHYLIVVFRDGELSNGKRVHVTKNVTASSAGSFVKTFTRGTYYQYVDFESIRNSSLNFEQQNTETQITYRIYIYKMLDLIKLFDEVGQNTSDLLTMPYHTMLFEDCLDFGANVADFSNFDSSDVIYNKTGTTANATEVSFNKNVITFDSILGGNRNVCVSLDDILTPGKEYLIRIFRKNSIAATSLSINENTTSNSVGTQYASFTASDDGQYFYTRFVAKQGLTLNTYLSHQNLFDVLKIYICESYTLPQPADITETKERENYANRMSWELLDDSTNGLSVTKVDNGVDITCDAAGNKIANFLLPQLKEGHNYTLRIECSTLTDTHKIQHLQGGSYMYTFTKDDSTYTLAIENYKCVYYPLQIIIGLKYNNALHNIRFYIYDDDEPTEKDVVKNSALADIDEGNFSEEFLNRCNYLDNNPTHYMGMDIMAFNKGICIGDSLTAGSMNTTDAQGNDGPALYTLRGAAFTQARSYPAKLAKMTGIEITTVAKGGITSYDFYETFKNQDWSGNEFAIIELGRNDVAQPPVGYGDWTEQSVTGFTNIINKLKTENNGIKIFVCNNTNLIGNKELWNLVNGIENLVSSLNDPNVILLDMHKYGSFNENTNAYQCGHLSQYGYYRLAQDYCNYISWYMATHKDEFRDIQFIGTNYVYTKDY